MTVERLMAEMTQDEFHQWQGFDLIEPIGDYRLDVLISQLRASLLNCHRSDTTPPFTLDGTLPKWGEKAIERTKTTEEIAEDLERSLSMFGIKTQKPE